MRVFMFNEKWSERFFFESYEEAPPEAINIKRSARIPLPLFFLFVGAQAGHDKKRANFDAILMFVIRFVSESGEGNSFHGMLSLTILH